MTRRMQVDRKISETELSEFCSKPIRITAFTILSREKIAEVGRDDINTDSLFVSERGGDKK
jgi:hypothetical protein